MSSFHPKRWAWIAIALSFPLASRLHAQASSSPSFAASEPPPAADATLGLEQLSLEQLMQLEVSTLSRKPEQWWSAAGAIDILTAEDIRRSGAQSITDALRLASGVHVAQPTAASWGVGIRGFSLPGGNKINVQIDGRTVFTPFYSGVFWDAQDTLMTDIDRIEVVRGPVGALWGAYAVNGFIQILSKPAWETQGWLSSAAISTENEHLVSMRYGGKTDADTFYRAYAQYRTRPSTYLDGEKADSSSDFLQTGFRVDARREEDTTLTLQGDAYTNRGLVREGSRDEFAGANLLARWQRLLSFDSEAQLVTYYDYTDRLFEMDLHEVRNTFQLNGKYRLTQGQHEIQLGTDNTLSWDRIGNIAGLQFDPTRRTIHTLSAFANDTYRVLPERLDVTAGVKIENNSFSGFEVQPTLRSAWTPSKTTTIWTAASRAVRTPTRFDEDVVFPGVFYANDDFKSEQVLALELGFRNKPIDVLAIDLALFSNRYNDLRSYQSVGSSVLPMTFENYLNARTDGAELTLLYQPHPRLSFKGTYRYLELYLSEDPGARDPVGSRFEANDPKHMGTLSTRIDLPAKTEFDATVRGVGSLPWLQTKGYITLDLRLGWTVKNQWEVSLIGRNLLDPYHVESIIPQQTSGAGRELARSVILRTTWAY